MACLDPTVEVVTFKNEGVNTQLGRNGTFYPREVYARADDMSQTVSLVTVGSHGALNIIMEFTPAQWRRITRAINTACKALK